MCGIVGAFGDVAAERKVEDALAAIAHRGPDAMAVKDTAGGRLGHVRLAIVDLDRRSDQPMTRGATTLAFNGELWNHRSVRAQLEALGRRFTTSGDTEVLAHALDAWGEEALARFEGMFACAWVGKDGTVRAARDRFGEVPLHVARTAGGGVAVSSEVRALRALGCRGEWHWVGPGEVWNLSRLTRRTWYVPPVEEFAGDRQDAAHRLLSALRAAAKERAMSDVPVATLLSGGLDSSIVAACLADVVPDLVAYTAVLDPHAPDLKHARAVASFLGVRLIEVSVASPTADDLARCVATIEMPHKAQVEIAWPCLALALAARANGHKVVYSGEGSDELWASYGFAYHGLKTATWRSYRERLFMEQHRKNFARCNKAFMRHGVECRLPFLSRPVVELALSLPERVVRDGKDARRAKMVLADAARGLVPDAVLTRAKTPFQAGIGLNKVAAVADPLRFYRLEHAREAGPWS